MYLSRLNRSMPPAILHRFGQTRIKLDEKFKPMIFHGENEAEILNSKVTVDWNITPESIDEPETLSESYHAILSFQDFTDFFGDLVEKQQKVMTAKKYTADNLKYLALNMLHVETEDNYYAPVRITIVDFDRNMVYDKIINPGGEVVNFRNCGLTQQEIEAGLSISETEIELEEVFKDTCVVGHNLSQFILNFSRPKESLDLAFYNPLHYLIMAITKVRYSGMMGLPEMSNFLLGDSMDDVESSDNLTHAQTIMQIFYFVVETLQTEATNQSFGIQNAAREPPLELRDKSLERRNHLDDIRLITVTPKQYYRMLQTGEWNKARKGKQNIVVDWSHQRKGTK